MLEVGLTDSTRRKGKPCTWGSGETNDIFYLEAHRSCSETKVTVSTALDKISEKAKRDSRCQFTSLIHILTPEFLKETWGQMNRKGANGVDGVTVQDYERDLCGFIPPPRANLVRYHGCFAPNFKDRKKIVKRPVPASQQSPCKEDPSEKKGRQERLRWAEMLKRVFEIDVTVCPKCSGRMEQIAVIKDKAVARQILESMNLRTIYRPLDEVEDRGPPRQEGLFLEDWDQRGESW